MKRNIIRVSVAILIVALFALMWMQHQRIRLEEDMPSVSPVFSSPLSRGTVNKRDAKNETRKEGRDFSLKNQNMTITAKKGGNKGIIEIDHGLTPVNRFGGEHYSDDVQRGKRKGAKGAITLRVVDTTGAPVAGAELFGGFWNNNPNDPPATGTSDANGELSVKGLCTGDFNFQITKDGYYKTSLRYWFFKTGFDCAKDGRWLPWNPTVEVILKEKRSPTSMQVKDVDTRVPVQNEPIGFDFAVGDWIIPHGKGQHSDMQVTYNHTMESGVWCIKCNIAFTNLYDGAYQFQQNVYSVFRSGYHADDSAEYKNEFDFVYERTSNKILQHKMIGDDAGLVFRIHGKTAHGVEGFRYGKIYGPIDFIAAGLMNIRFSYFFNPVENDTNLEFDGAGFQGGWR